MGQILNLEHIDRFWFSLSSVITSIKYHCKLMMDYSYTPYSYLKKISVSSKVYKLAVSKLMCTA